MSMVTAATSEYLKVLKPAERVNFLVLNRLNWSPGIRRVLTKIGSVWGRFYVELGTSRTVWHHGFEKFAELDPNRGVLLVANHRTFYDQFVITARLFRLFGAHHNIYFPVRSEFFYDNLLGLPVNLSTAVGGMYPPIVRDKKRRSWNKFATDLMVELLKRPENMIGFHPEGKRNRGPDPYSLLRAQPGCGELIYRARPNVVPVFLQGFPSRFWVLLRQNWNKSQGKQPVVHMVMGEPMDFSEQFEKEASMKTYLRISREVMHRIEELSIREKEIRAGLQTQTAEVVL